MIELELLGANGDTVVMTDGTGERYSIIVEVTVSGLSIMDICNLDVENR